jgi:hypothetical protein
MSSFCLVIEGLIHVRLGVKNAADLSKVKKLEICFHIV